jgi:hypothetical protein
MVDGRKAAVGGASGSAAATGTTMIATETAIVTATRSRAAAEAVELHRIRQLRRGRLR